MTYEIHDNYGLSQCAPETIKCEEWYEVEYYFDDPDAMERLENGYATIVEVE